MTAATRFSIQLYSATVEGPVNWRLLSANNRECGRGAGGFADSHECRTGVAQLQSRTDRMRRRCRRDAAGRWRWELELDGQLVATSGHTFDRLVRCELGVQQFVAGFATAAVRPTMTVSGARRWGSVA